MIKSSPAKARKIIDGIHEFLQQEIKPREKQLLAEASEDNLNLLGLLREKIKAANLWAPHLPEMYGGLSLPVRDFARVCEELGRSPLGHHIFNCQEHTLLNMGLLMDVGSFEQKERFLRPLARGEIACGTSLTDQTLFSSAEEFPSLRRSEQEDTLIITGSQWLVSSSPAMSYFTGIARPEEGRGSSLALIPAETEGLYLQPEHAPASAAYSSQMHFLAEFSDCELPAHSLLGDENSGSELLENHLTPVRIFKCMRWIGICERTLDIASRRIAKRKLLAGGDTAATFRDETWLAETRAEINAGRLLVLTTAHKIDKEGAENVRADSAMCLFHVAGILRRLFDRVNGLFSGPEILAEPVLAHWMYHERNAGIYEIPDELLRQQVATHLLKRFKIK